MSSTENLILDLGDAAYGADAVLKSNAMAMAIDALRAAGDVAQADELAAMIEDARAAIQAARVAAGFVQGAR